MNIHILPFPYPDESWYSMIARYHRMSGNMLSAETKRELFGHRVKGYINPIDADYTIVNYLDAHEEIEETAEDYITKYTLAPYHLRYYSRKRKLDILNKLSDMEINNRINVFTNHSSAKIDTNLRYCPMCIEDDIKKYGEAYWHRSHQIWIVKKCPIHGCELLESTITLARASYHFSCADELTCPNDTVKFDNSPFDKLIPYADASLNAPFTFHENAVTDSLINAAIDAGYGELRSKGFVCKGKQLYEDIKSYYGKDFVERFFTADTNGSTIRRVFSPTWNSRVEPAILTAAFLEIPVVNLFEKEDREVKIRKELIKCSKYGMRWPKASLAKHLGVKMARLDVLAKDAGIEPFWGLPARKEKLIEYKAAFYLSKEEWEVIEKGTKEIGASSKKEFFIYCVRKELGLIEQQ